MRCVWLSAQCSGITPSLVQDQKSHFDRIKADGESFKQQVLLQHSNTSREVDSKAQGESNGCVDTM